MPCCPWPWDNSRGVAVVGSGEERPQPPTIVLPRFSVSLPSCSQRDPHWPWTRGDAGSAGAPAPPPAQSWVQIPALPLTHCGTPWELPLEDLPPPFLGENKQRSARTRMPWPRPCKGGSSPALTRRGVGLPIGAHLWAQDPHPWKKRRGWAGSEEKPGLRTSVLVHTRIFHAPAWTLTHVIQIKRPTYKHTHSTGHCLPQLHRSPPPRYINSPCPPVSPAITYLILGY